MESKKRLIAYITDLLFRMQINELQDLLTKLDHKYGKSK